MGKGALVVFAMALIAFAAGCGSTSTPTARREKPQPLAATHKSSPGIGWKAPITKTVAPRHLAAGVGRLPGVEVLGASPCMPEEGHGEIGIFTDVPQPGCVRVAGAEPVLIVNRTEAYHRSEGQPVTVRLGPYRARLRPQQAIRIAPAGRFLEPGYHHVTLGAGPGGVGILVLPKDCAINRPEPGEPLCFSQDKAGRLRRWRRTLAKMGAPACRGGDLTVAAERHSSIGSGGTIYTRLFVTNHSRRPCTVAGVPKVAGVDRDGKVVGVAASRPNIRPGAKGGRRRVKLRPGGSATFDVVHYDGIGAGRCKFTSTYGLRVRIPGAGPHRFVHYRFEYCPAADAGLGLRVGKIE
jgi:hypothetical protein